MQHIEHDKDSTGTVLLKYWPIIVAVSITLLSLGGIFVKLDYIAKAIDRTDTQFSQINDRQNLTSQRVIEMGGQITQVSNDNARLAQSLAELRGRVDLISDKARWAPGGNR